MCTNFFNKISSIDDQLTKKFKLLGEFSRMVYYVSTSLTHPITQDPIGLQKRIIHGGIPCVEAQIPSMQPTLLKAYAVRWRVENGLITFTSLTCTKLQIHAILLFQVVYLKTWKLNCNFINRSTSYKFGIAPTVQGRVFAKLWQKYLI